VETFKNKGNRTSGAIYLLKSHMTPVVLKDQQLRVDRNEARKKPYSGNVLIEGQKRKDHQNAKNETRRWHFSGERECKGPEAKGGRSS